MGRVVLGFMLEEGAGQLLHCSIRQSEAFEDSVAGHADYPRVVCSSRAEQALSHGSDQSGGHLVNRPWSQLMVNM